MYNWLVFLHILTALLLMLAHGAHAAAMLKFRGEPDPEQSLTFFNIVPEITLVRYLTVVLGVFGFAAVIVAGWWKQGWVWTSAVIFILISIIMFKYGAGYFGIIQDAALRLINARKTGTNQSAAQKEFDAARNSPYPMFVSVSGVLGLAIILWLMRFKPF